MKKTLKNIYLIFGVSFAMMVTLTFLSYRKWTAFSDYTNHVEHSNQVLHHINALESTLIAAESAQRGFLLTSDSSQLRIYDSLRAEIKPILQNLKSTMEPYSSQKDRVIRVQALVLTRLNYLERSLYSAKTISQKELAVNLQMGKQVMDTCRMVINDIEAFENTMLDNRGNSRKFYMTTIPQFFSALMILSALISFGSFIMILHETRRRGSYQKELEQKLLELDRNNKELEQINFAASHSLQEPLRKISVFGDILNTKYSTELTPEASQMLQRIHHSAQHMLTLLGDLVNFTNLARSQEKMRTTNLNRLIDGLLEEYEEELNQMGAEVTVGQLPEVVGYREQLRLMFNALIDNAIKFARPEVPLKLEISATEVPREETNGERVRQETTFAKIVVRDNGRGFDNKFNDRIFLIFQQLDKSENDKGKGLGLAIVRRVMVNHQGSVRAEGTPDRGAAFFLYFPIVKGT